VTFAQRYAVYKSAYLLTHFLLVWVQGVVTGLLWILCYCQYQKSLQKSVNDLLNWRIHSFMHSFSHLSIQILIVNCYICTFARTILMFMIHGNVDCHLAVVCDVLNLHLCGILLTREMTYNVSSGMLKRTILTTSSCRLWSSWLTVSRQYNAGHPSYDDVTGRQSIFRRWTACLEQPSSCAVAVWVASRPEACRLSQLQGCGFESAPLTSIA